jgi:hypothetical protein
VVVGHWSSSPFGAFTDVMVEDSHDRRTLLAPDRQIGDYVSSVYDFDEVLVEALEVDRRPGRLRVAGGPLAIEVFIGRRDLLGWTLRCVPRRIATSPRFAAMVDPIARTVLRGVRTRGTTAGGEEYYAATDRHRVERIGGSWHSNDLGVLAAVDPPVRFGFSSTPRQPSIVRVVTTVHRS